MLIALLALSSIGYHDRTVNDGACFANAGELDNLALRDAYDDDTFDATGGPKTTRSPPTFATTSGRTTRSPTRARRRRWSKIAKRGRRPLRLPQQCLRDERDR